LSLSLLLAAAEGGHAISLFPEMSELIWTVVDFTVLFLALYKFLYKPLLGAISKREEEINAMISTAKADQAEAERLRKEFEAKISEAQREAQAILNQANKAATNAKEQIEGEARAKAAEMIENATKTIEREKAKAVAELRGEVANLAVQIAGKVIDKNLNNEEQKRLANDFVAKVGE
jgi:F-type H+-transporting ATPase subunit b